MTENSFLPVKPEPNQRFSVVLDDQNCTIELYQRFDHLYANVFVDDNPVILGAVCLDRAVITMIDQNKFRGDLYFMDNLGTNDPQWEGLGERYSLLYAPPWRSDDGLSS